MVLGPDGGRFFHKGEKTISGPGRVLDSGDKNPIMKSRSGDFTVPCLNIRFGFAEVQAINIDSGSNIYAVLCSGEGWWEAGYSMRMVIPAERSGDAATQGWLNQA